MARIVTDQKTRVVSAPVAIIVAVVSAGYMLPWAIAAVRGNRNAWSVFWVNLLLGWTVVGWIVALIFAIAMALRLARFNVMAGDVNRPKWQQGYFVGVPAPGAALVVLLPVYLELIGGRQPDLVLDAPAVQAQDGVVLVMAHRRARPVPLPPRLTTAEVAAHAAFVARMGDKALWLRYTAASG